MVDQVTEIVRAFIAAHPELAPEKFGFPSDFLPLRFFLATEAVRLFMRRYAREVMDDPGAVMMLRDDGTILHGRKAVISAGETCIKVATYTDCWVNAGSSGTMHDPVIVPALVRWIVAAIVAKPDLLRGYVMTARTDGEMRDVTLTPIPTAAGDDSLEYWRV